GLIAGAAGAARATGRATGLLLGDVSYLHDVASLASAPANVPLVLVVINDGGGRIFERLPIRSAVEEVFFERVFASTHGRDLGALAKAFGAAYDRVDGPETFEGSVREAARRGGPSVIEVPLEAGADKRTLGALEAVLAPFV
ncbi:MAG: thiamine pyrophosphate-dependent enzyme, partial [Myxococcota bacterium]